MKVEDSTGAAEFVVFGETGDALIGASVATLVVVPVVDAQCPPVIFYRVVGKTKNFEVTVKENDFVKRRYDIITQKVTKDNDKNHMNPSQSSSSFQALAGSSSGSCETPKQIGKRSLNQSESQADDSFMPMMKKQHGIIGELPGSNQNELIEELWNRLCKTPSTGPPNDGETVDVSEFKTPKEIGHSFTTSKLQQMQDIHAVLVSLIADNREQECHSCSLQIEDRGDTADGSIEKLEKSNEETQTTKIEVLKTIPSELNAEETPNTIDMQEVHACTASEVIQGQETSSGKSIASFETNQKSSRTKVSNCAKKESKEDCS